MREGVALIHTPMLNDSMMGTIPGLGFPIPEIRSPATGADTVGEKLLWRERTGAKTGWLVKSDETKTMEISGHRCLKCGYIEFFANE